MALHPPAAACSGRRVAHHGLRGDDHLAAGFPDPETELGISAEVSQDGREAAERAPQVAPDEHPRAADCHRGDSGVVLALVSLSSLKAGESGTDCGEARSHFKHMVGALPVHDLRAYDASAGMGICSLQQVAQSSRVGGAVVMQQPEPLHSPLDRLSC